MNYFRIKKLNEELSKLLEEEINEISNDVIGAARNKRTQNFSDARDNFLKGKVSASTLKKSGDKLRNFNDLLDKRGKRLDSQKKHLVIPDETLTRIEKNGEKLLDLDYKFIGDDELVKLANLQADIYNNTGNTITTIEDAKELFNQDKEYLIYIDMKDLIDNKFKDNDGYKRGYKIMLDTTPDQAAAEIDKTGDAARKQVEKFEKFKKNFLKYVEKGTIADVTYEGEDDRETPPAKRFNVTLHIKNPGFPSTDVAREYLPDDWQDMIRSWSLPKPEPRTDNSYVEYYSDVAKHSRLFWVDNKTLKIDRLWGREVFR